MMTVMNEKHLKDCKREFENCKISKKHFWKGAITDILHGNPERAAMWVLHCEDVQYAREVMKEIYEDKLKELTKQIGTIYQFLGLIGMD